MRQRLVNIMGKGYNERLAPMGVDTDFVKVAGFIGKPEFAKHTRGEQFFFLNRRFIKNHFFHHAVQSAYQGLLAHDRHPLYMIHIEVDPATVDVNIHPTKTEVKFRDEKAVYAVIHAAVREAIGKFALSPSLDFEQEQSLPPMSGSGAGFPMRPPEIKINPDYNPFRTEPKTPNLASRYSPESGSSPADWRQLFEVAKTFSPGAQHEESEPTATAYLPGLGEETFEKPLFQLMNKYVVTVIKSGLMVVDIRRARERIFYEQFITAGADSPAAVQQLLFPLTVEVSAADAALIDSMSEDLQKAGFDVSAFGRESIIVNGLPADCEIADPARFIEVFLEQVKHETDVLRNPAREAVFRSLARSASARPHRHLEKEEMRDLIDRLFACEAPGHAPGGLPVLITFSGTELEEKFKSR
jgi:DNA mismatch repair protein MutL